MAPVSGAIEPTSTIEPPPAAFMRLAAAAHEYQQLLMLA